jgi:hypothetical protein
MKKLLIILFLSPLITSAQIAVTMPVAGSANTANTTSYSMTAFTPAAQSLLVVFVFATGTVQNSATSPSMVGGSLTWTREAISVIGATNELVIFWARVGASPVSTTISYDCTGDGSTGVVMNVFQFTGYDQITKNPIRQSKLNTTTTTSTNATLTFNTALATGNGYALGWYGLLGASVSTPPSSPSAWTEGDDIAFTTPATNGATAYLAGGATTTGPFTFTSASTTWQAMGVEVYVRGAGPGTRDFFRSNK